MGKDKELNINKQPEGGVEAELSGSGRGKREEDIDGHIFYSTFLGGQNFSFLLIHQGTNWAKGGGRAAS